MITDAATRLAELRAIGWVKMTKEQKDEYRKLTTPTKAIDTKPKTHHEAFTDLFKLIKDADARAIILKYANLNSEEPFRSLAVQMMKDMMNKRHTIECRGVVQTYIDANFPESNA